MILIYVNGDEYLIEAEMIYDPFPFRVPVLTLTPVLLPASPLTGEGNDEVILKREV